MNAISDVHSNPPPGHRDGPPDLHQMLRIFSRRRGVFGWTVAIIMVLATIAAFGFDPRYVAEAVVLVDARKAQVANIPEVLSDLPSDVAAVRSEMSMIGSNELIATVVDRLRLDRDPEFAQPPVLLPLARRLAEKVPALAAWLPTPGQEAIERRLDLLDRVRKRLTTSNDGRSYNIQITFRTRDPAKSARIVNAFANAYVEAQVDVRNNAARQASTWLENRLAELRERVAEADRKAQDYREHSALNKSMGATSIARELAELNTTMAQVKDDRSRAEARVASIRAARQTGQLDSLSDVVKSSLIQNLRQQEAAIRQKQVEVAARYAPNHPILQTIAAQLADIELRMANEMRRIAAAAENDLDVATKREANIRSQVAALESRNDGLMRSDVQLRELERVADASRLVYETFLSRLRETSQEQHLSKADARVVSHATAPIRSRFPVPVILAAGLASALLAGALLALLADYQDASFRTSAQVEEETAVPVAGMLPLLKRGEGLPERQVVAAPQSVFTEAALRVANTLGLGNEGDNKGVAGPVLLVSSAVPGEGKTSVVALMARMLAANGRRVLAIEADLRRPGLARALGIAPGHRPGLAGVLKGEAVPVRAIIEAEPNLHCLPAGSGAAQFKHLLASATMRRTIQALRPAYDCILIDSPPASALADPLMMAALADSRLLVVQWGTTPREAVTKTVELFRRQGAAIDAIVLNQVDLARQARFDHSDYAYCVTRYQAYYGT